MKQNINAQQYFKKWKSDESLIVLDSISSRYYHVIKKYRDQLLQILYTNLEEELDDLLLQKIWHETN